MKKLVLLSLTFITIFFSFGCSTSISIKDFVVPINDFEEGSTNGKGHNTFNFGYSEHLVSETLVVGTLDEETNSVIWKKERRELIKSGLELKLNIGITPKIDLIPEYSFTDNGSVPRIGLKYQLTDNNDDLNISFKGGFGKSFGKELDVKSNDVKNFKSDQKVSLIYFSVPMSYNLSKDSAFLFGPRYIHYSDESEYSGKYGEDLITGSFDFTDKKELFGMSFGLRYKFIVFQYTGMYISEELEHYLGASIKLNRKSKKH